MLQALLPLGIKVVGEPAGAFYLYLDVSALTSDSEQWCLRLLEEKKLALTPGKDFGPLHGPGNYVRLAYTTSVERLEEAVSRLRAFIEAGA